MIGNRHSCLEDPEIHKFQSYQILATFMSAVQVLCSLAETLQASNDDVPFSFAAEDLSFLSHNRAETLPMQHH